MSNWDENKAGKNICFTMSKIELLVDTDVGLLYTYVPPVLNRLLRYLKKTKQPRKCHNTVSSMITARLTP